MSLTLITDSREQTPLPFHNLTTEKGTLYSGDYSISGMEESFSIERKAISDLVSSLTSDRNRFMNEMHRLRGYRFRRLLIVGNRIEIELHRYRSRAKPRSILASLAAVEARYDVSAVFVNTPAEAGLTIERWAFWYWREVQRVNNKNLKTPEWAISI